jgi:hypothetical protein
MRTPLTAGYVWLVDIWMVFGSQFLRRQPTRGPIALLWGLGNLVDRTVLLAAITFVAYLIGSLLEIQPQRLWDFGGRPRRVSDWLNRVRRDVRILSRFRFHALSTNAQADLRTVARDADPSLDDEGWEKVLRRTLGEVRQLATRLQTTNVELYDKYERLLAEATFRLNIVPPMVVLLLVVIAQSPQDTWRKVVEVLVLATFVIVALRQVVGRIVQSNEVIMQALVVGLVESRTVKRLARANNTASESEDHVSSQLDGSEESR